MKKKYDTVIFDMDGTVMNTLVDLMDSINYVLEKYNYPFIELGDIGGYMGKGLDQMAAQCFPGGETDPNFKEGVEIFKEYYGEHCQIKTAPYDGIIDLMAALKDKGYKLAIVSNKAHEPLQELNNQFFSAYVTVAIGEKEGITKKPAPDGVNLALELLGSTKETSIYVGDTEVDRETAVNADLDCVMVAWGFRSMDILQTLDAMKIIETPIELLEVLE